MERLERGDTEGLEGIALRRTNGEVTAVAGVGERQEVPSAGGKPVTLSDAFLVSE